MFSEAALIRKEVSKLLKYKMLTNVNLFLFFMASHFIGYGLIFLTNVGMGSNGLVDVSFNEYSASIVIWISLFWAAIFGFQLTTKRVLSETFIFSSAHSINHIANGIFVLVISIITGTLTFLSAPLVRTVVILFTENGRWSTEYLILSFSDYAYGISGTILYFILFISVAYLTGILIFLKKEFLYVLLLILFLIMFLNTQIPFLLEAIHFYFLESSLLLFTFKVIITYIVCFSLAYITTSKKEVGYL